MTNPAFEAENTSSSFYSAHMVIEAIMQGKHSSNHSYSSPVKGQHVAGQFFWGVMSNPANLHHAPDSDVSCCIPLPYYTHNAALGAAKVVQLL